MLYVPLLTRCLPGNPRGYMRTKLTPGFVKTATAIDGKDRTIFWDQTMSGFGLMVTAAGSRSYVVQYRAGRSSRRLTIDGVLSLDEARKQAKKTLGSVAKGGDPLAERRAELAAGADTLQSITEEYFARESKKLRSYVQRRAVSGTAGVPQDRRAPDRRNQTP